MTTFSIWQWLAIVAVSGVFYLGVLCFIREVKKP